MIQTETTPNPDSIKFLSENIISAAGTEEFSSSKKNEISNKFIQELLNFKGVELILLSKNFLSVNKTKEVSWDELKPMVISHLNDYFEKNKEPILKNKNSNNNINNKDETVNKILEVLDTKIRPAVVNSWLTRPPIISPQSVATVVHRDVHSRRSMSISSPLRIFFWMQRATTVHKWGSTSCAIMGAR